MRSFTRLCSALGALAVLAAGAAPALADYPDRPIRLIVSMPPGGGADFVARLVASKAQEKLGGKLVVENRAGADGMIAAAFVANAAPDGYTLAWITNSHVVSPLFHTPSYKPADSFTPVIQVASAPDVLLVPKTLPVDTLPALIEMAKAKPHSIVYGSAGVSTPSSLESQLLMKVTGAQLEAVPYKGGSEAILGLLNDSVNMYFATISTALSTLKGGKVKALAVSTLKRTSQLPDVPTVAEAIGYPSFEGGTWLGVLAPAGTPAAVVDKVNGAIAYALQTTEVQQQLSAQGWTVIASTPQVFDKVLRSDLDRWAEALKDMPKTQ
ncbi:MAG TPA: tripartite tricarboxylate transporter substrate-binding protein [Bordetella sp.]|nr:tripartite tricarboxylate transporter substrate-binding protein [Bordetella sp.]